MPVLEHPVSPLVVQKADARPGCYNRPPFSKGYWAPDREYTFDGRFVEKQRFIKHTMSTECRYDQAMHPESCDGCKHYNGGKYVKSISKEGK